MIRVKGAAREGATGLAEAVRRARANAEATIALFEHQVLPHHADEEQDLFVAVRRSAAPGAELARVEDLVARLVAQHRQVERMWTALRPSVRALAAGKPAPAPCAAAALGVYLTAWCAAKLHTLRTSGRVCKAQPCAPPRRDGL